MLEFVSYKNYQTALREVLKSIAKICTCVAYNTVALNKLYNLDILPINDGEYPYQKQMNDVCDCVSQIMSHGPSIKQHFSNFDCSRTYYNMHIIFDRVDFIFSQSKYLLEIAGIHVGDGAICDRMYDDVEQFKYMLDLMSKEVIEELEIAKKTLTKEIERLDSIYNFSTPKPPQKQKYQKKDAFLDQFTSGGHIKKEKEDIGNQTTNGSETIKNDGTDTAKKLDGEERDK